MSNPFDLTGKVAIVTGANGQLGTEYVQSLLNAGAKVAGFDCQFEHSRGKPLPEESDTFIKVTVDITQRDQLEKALESVVNQLGHPTVLVNNAAIDAPPDADASLTGSFEHYPLDAFKQTIDVNILGVVLCCQVIGKDMADHQGGSIINISSIYGILSPDQRIYEYKKEPFYKPAAYSVTKSSLLNLTRYLSTYWSENNVRVNTLTIAGVFNNQDEKFLNNYCPKVPLGRMANPDEYNGSIIFLASDASSYMTGSNLIVDGGYSAW